MGTEFQPATDMSAPYGPPLFPRTSHHAQDPVRTAGKANAPRTSSTNMTARINPGNRQSHHAGGGIHEATGKDQLPKCCRERAIGRCGMFRSPTGLTAVQSGTDPLLPGKDPATQQAFPADRSSPSGQRSSTGRDPHFSTRRALAVAGRPGCSQSLPCWRDFCSAVPDQAAKPVQLTLSSHSLN